MLLRNRITHTHTVVDHVIYKASVHRHYLSGVAVRKSTASRKRHARAQKLFPRRFTASGRVSRDVISSRSAQVHVFSSFSPAPVANVHSTAKHFYGLNVSRSCLNPLTRASTLETSFITETKHIGGPILFAYGSRKVIANHILLGIRRD